VFKSLAFLFVSVAKLMVFDRMTQFSVKRAQEALVRRREADALAFRQRTGGERTGRQLHFPPDQQARHHIASAGSRSSYAIPVALLAFVLAYLYWPLRLVALAVAYMYWRNSR
jgi:hypothetical protein